MTLVNGTWEISRRVMRIARGFFGAMAAVAIVATTIVPMITTMPAAAIAQEFTVDSAASESLTNYLKQNRLPLVGAQIGTASTGARRLVLYGYVATQMGKSNAESKAIAYLGAPRPDVVNRIVIQPEIGKMKSGGGQAGSAARTPDNSQTGDIGAYAGAGGGPAGGAFPGESIDQVLDDIQRYGLKSPPQDPAVP